MGYQVQINLNNNKIKHLNQFNSTYLMTRVDQREAMVVKITQEVAVKDQV